ncbi:uncharacterized protein [Periplaneta americana]|uniref:uncharacterized protein n=1 Tax=Periplaneta americana TaxID=6978 RepID=UPI0037E9B5EA
MTREFTEALIEKVREYVFLYDTGHPDYKNILKKAEAWRDISEELGKSSETVKQKWKNLRDSYIKYKRFIKGTTRQAAKKYQKWPWSNHLEFLDYTLRPRSTTSSASDTQITETPPPCREAEDSCPVFPASLEMSPPPMKKLKHQSTLEVDKVIDYLEQRNTNKNQLDGTDHLFLSYAETFKKLPPRRQALLKIELATLFARAEISELDAQTTAPRCAGLTTDKSKEPQDFVQTSQ